MKPSTSSSRLDIVDVMYIDAANKTKVPQQQILNHSKAHKGQVFGVVEDNHAVFPAMNLFARTLPAGKALNKTGLLSYVSLY